MRWLLAVLLIVPLTAEAAIVLEVGGGQGEDKIVLSDAKCTAKTALSKLRADTHQHYKQATYYNRDKSPSIQGCWREFQGVGTEIIGMVWDDGDTFAIPKEQFRKPVGA